MPDNFLSHANKLKEIVENASSQQLIFFKRKKSGNTSKYEAYNFELDQNSIGSNLKNIVISSIETNRTCRLKGYTIEIDSNEKNTIYEISSNDVGNFRKIIDAMTDEYFIRKLAKINLENKIEIVRNNFESLVQANKDFQELGVQINTETKTILIPHNADKNYIRSVLSLLNTEPMQNLISQAKVLIPDNNTPVQQRLFLA